MTVNWGTIVVFDDNNITSRDPLLFISDILPYNSSYQTVCFTSSGRDGLFIDNVSVVSVVFEEVVEFGFEGIGNYTQLISNYSVELSKI